MIKYHQNGLGNEYGEDHRLTNNWNPSIDYKNEYSNVYFRIEAEKCKYPSFSFTEEENKAFYNEVKAALHTLGWRMKDNSEDWESDYIVKGNQTLYLHPQNFSGEIMKNEVKQIAEALEKHNTFYLRWVDLYDTVYDISDNEYEEYLNGKDEEMRKDLFENYGTTRTTKYYYGFDICGKLTDKYGLRRVSVNDGINYGKGQAMQHISSLIDSMGSSGLLVVKDDNGTKYVRSLNKTEQKRLKICSVA